MIQLLSDSAADGARLNARTARHGAIGRRRRAGGVLGFALLLLGIVGNLAIRAYALDPSRDLTQYNCRTWTRETGLPVNGITAVAETNDGYIWIGTTKGLARFDGEDFVRFDFAGQPKVRTTVVRSIATARKGGLWVGLENSGFGYFDGQSYTPLSRDAWGGEYVNVAALVEDADGTVWLGTPGGVSRVDLAKGTYESMLRTTDSATYNVLGGGRDAMGRMWFTTVDFGVHLWDRGRHWQLTDADLEQSIPHATVVEPDGHVWIGTSRGVMRYDKHFRRTDVFYAGEETRAVLIDRAGAVWLGGNRGLHRYWHGALQTLTQENGLASGGILALCEDHEGSIWVGTREGLSLITDVKFPTLPASENPQVHEVYAVAASPRGGVWAATAGDVTYYDDGKLKSYGPEIGMPATVFKRVFEAKNGDVYVVAGAKNLLVLAGGKVVTNFNAPNMVVGMAEDDRSVIVSVGGGLFRANRDQLVPYPVPREAPPMYWILNLLVSRDGALWVATVNGVFRLKDGAFQHWGTSEGATDPSVFTLAEDDDGVVWFGTLNGIARVKDGRVHLIGREDGLFDNNIYAIVPDHLGNVWVDAGRGIFRVSRRNLNDFVDGRVARIECTAYDGQESVRATDKTSQERVGAMSRDGRVWLATAKGVIVIDPRHIPRNEAPPPVWIHHVEANGVELPRSAGATVQPGRGELQFQFTALSYIAPQKIKFKYRLEGYDQNWIEVSGRRLAMYNNLRPGRYTFRVTAANADGVWNNTGDSVSIVLLPHFYQTVWFFIACGAMVCGGLGGIYGARVRHLHRKARLLQENRERLEAEVQRRTAELAQTNCTLQHEVDERTRAEEQLKQRTTSLETEIEERKRMEREVERVHRELLEVSRYAGMAEVATGVLHNVGNVLNSVNVSATLVIDRIQRSRVPNVGKLAALLEQHAGDLSSFLTSDRRGQQVPIYLRSLSDHLVAEQKAVVDELDGLRKNIGHINEIVAMQQSHAKAVGVTEMLPVSELMEDAIRINAAAIDRHGLTLVRQFEANPTITVERHKVMQILINLIRNAKYACDESGRKDKVLTLKIATDDTHVHLAVIDNGVGIPPENLTRIFAHGFTTRKEGHGFGLHTSALAARELGGSLTGTSEGPGRGATFVLSLPLRPTSAANAPATAPAVAAAVVAVGK